MVNRQGFQRIYHSLLQGTILAFAWVNWGKTWKPLSAEPVTRPKFQMGTNKLPSFPCSWQFLSQSSIYSMGNKGSLPGVKWPGCEANKYFLLLLRFRMYGALPPYPQHALIPNLLSICWFPCNTFLSEAYYYYL